MIGDHPLNLAATGLALNAYMLTGEEKYRNWLLEYAGAWKERTLACGGKIPTNVGLDGKPGGVYNGQWWKGTYGWNFTIYDGEIERIAHRNYSHAGSWPGFGNALLASGDQGWTDLLRRQMDLIYEQKKVENGRVLLPQMYGDPRGYRYNGPPQWYHYTENLFIDRLTEIYLRSMDRRDLERIPKTGWIGFLEGREPDYPVRALRQELAAVRRKVEAIRGDTTTPDTRLADYLLDLNPVRTDELVKLMWGGYFAGRIWMLHSRFRYFDPAQRRAGLPPDVGALVEKLAADSAALVLVNLNPIEARTVIVQAGGYGEHQFDEAELGERRIPIGGPLVTARLAPGCGGRIAFRMTRYKNRPTLAHPWDRGWFGGS